MRFGLNIVVAVLLALIFTSCSPEHSKIVLVDYGDYNISMEEFEQAYAKNVGGLEQAKKDSVEKFKDFLNLYANYKMKLRDAAVRGYDNNDDLQYELEDYRRKVGSTYIIEKKIIEPGLRKFYDERMEEYRISHIMIMPDSGSFLKAEKKANQIIEMINNGADYAQLAKEYSEDKHTKDDGGDIYWVTAGQIISVFEDAAKATKTGEIYPEPVQTQFGYHIIKVTDRQPRKPSVKASHILVNFKNADGVIDTAAALAEATELRNKLLNGADFAELAKNHSDDEGTALGGGDLGSFERKKMVKPFDEAAFNLKVNEISEVIESNYGFHIIQVTEIGKNPSFEDEKTNLRDQYKRTRYEKEKMAFADTLRKKFDFQLDTMLMDEIVKEADTIRFNDSYLNSKLRAKYKDRMIFSLNGKPVVMDSIYAYSQTEKKYTDRLINEKFMNVFATELSEKIAFEEYAGILEKEDPEFARLMDDYKNGIYIFKIQEDEIWNNVKIDSADVYAYYEKNKSNFTYPDRVDFSEILCRQDSSSQRIYNLVMNGVNFDSLAKEETQRGGFRAKSGKHGMVEVSSGELAAKAYSLTDAGEISEPFKTKDGFSIIRLNAKDPARNKTFEEARPEAASAFQELESKRLESEYLQKLKNTYQPNYYYEELTRAFKENK
ncbi:MAG: peptidylprolyl isomerase [Bacteroidetes bacterium]|nr:peptidylprolyl isomerase [Bacteroidota bacterium]